MLGNGARPFEEIEVSFFVRVIQPLSLALRQNAWSNFVCKFAGILLAKQNVKENVDDGDVHGLTNGEDVLTLESR